MAKRQTRLGPETVGLGERIALRHYKRDRHPVAVPTARDLKFRNPNRSASVPIRKHRRARTFSEKLLEVSLDDHLQPNVAGGTV